MPLLFNMYYKLWLMHLGQDKEIQGMLIRKEEMKLFVSR